MEEKSPAGHEWMTLEAHFPPYYVCKRCKCIKSFVSHRGAMCYSHPSGITFGTSEPSCVPLKDDLG